MSEKTWMHPRKVKPINAYVRTTKGGKISVVSPHLHEYPEVVDTSLVGHRSPTIDATDLKKETVPLNKDTYLHFFKFDGNYYGMLIHKTKYGMDVSDPEKLSDIEYFKTDKDFIYLKFRHAASYTIPKKGFSNLKVSTKTPVVGVLQKINTYLRQVVLKRLG